MPHLYIANTTRQRQIIYYRLDFNFEGNPNAQNGKACPSVPIEPGKQMMITGDHLHMKQIESIVSQLSRYGLQGESDIRAAKGKQRFVIPFVFNVGAVVSKKVIEDVLARNEALVGNQGQERRRLAAINVNHKVQTTVAESLLQNGINPELGALTRPIEVEMEQMEQTEAGEKTIAEGYRITDEADRTKPPTDGGRHGRRGRKAA